MLMEEAKVLIEADEDLMLEAFWIGLRRRSAFPPKKATRGEAEPRANCKLHTYKPRLKLENQTTTANCRLEALGRSLFRAQRRE